MNEVFGQNFILNGEIQLAGDFENSLVYEGDSVYEVVRMIKGNPVFFNDHMERLTASVKNQERKMLADILEIRRSIINLIRSEGKRNANLKIVFNYNGARENFLVYLIEPIYPSPAQYRNGVKGILFHAVRKDPGSKVINHRLRSSIYHRLILENAYEAILINHDGQITEGSRSNIFFLGGGKLVTAPDKYVLSGITRKYILEICRLEGIGVELRCVRSDEIGDFDSAFMTGTSPMVLPFSVVGDTAFNVKVPLIRHLREKYMAMAIDSVRLFRQIN
jgi:branched-chain amino acid aminotransferase